MYVYAPVKSPARALNRPKPERVKAIEIHVPVSNHSEIGICSPAKADKIVRWTPYEEAIKNNTTRIPMIRVERLKSFVKHKAFFYQEFHLKNCFFFV
jgi:hypothetical protein